VKIKFLCGEEKVFDRLVGANLTGADLHSTNLTNADLFSANLTNANLTGANLTNADLSGANLTNANLTGANLTNANLTGANLHSANLTGANLTNANLYSANLYSANLSYANLTDVDLSAFRILPEKGCFRAFKKILTVQGRKVIEIEIAASAQRVSPLGQRKCRASKVRVIPGQIPDGGWSIYNRDFKYVDGGEVKVDDFDPDVRVTCTRGIHFFLTRAEAEAY